MQVGLALEINQIESVSNKGLLSLINLEIFKVVHPAPISCNIRGNGFDINALGAEDNDVLTLIGRNFKRPVDNDVEAGFVVDLR